MREAAKPLLVLVALLALAPAGAGQTVSEVVERARPAVAVIRTQRSQGSGFVSDSLGVLLTAAHVVDGASEILVRLPNRPPMPAIVAQLNRALDVAALRVGQTRLPFIPLSDAYPRAGEDILVLGYPLATVIGADDLTVTRGVVSRLLLDQGLLQFDASVNPGNSGGPVLNTRGEAVGIVVAGVRGATGLNFAVLSVVAKDVARLASQTPFAPTTPTLTQTPTPSATPTPADGQWTILGSKGPTPRNTTIRTPTNLAIRQARYRVEDNVLYVEVELYERPTGDAEVALEWRLSGSSLPRLVLRYFVASGRAIFGRVKITDETRRLINVDPLTVQGMQVSRTGTFLHVALPVHALQPPGSQWELRVSTRYRTPNDIYTTVDWLEWTRLSL